MTNLTFHNLTGSHGKSKLNELLSSGPRLSALSKCFLISLCATLCPIKVELIDKFLVVYVASLTFNELKNPLRPFILVCLLKIPAKSTLTFRDEKKKSLISETVSDTSSGSFPSQDTFVGRPLSSAST